MASGRILVTGGNRGLGLETCRQLAAKGRSVVVACRDLSSGQRAAESIDGDVEAVELDVTNSEHIERLAGSVGELFSLVNNAGASFDGFNAEVARRTLDVNYVGARSVADGLAPNIVDGGNIVMVSSGMGSLSRVSGELAARFSADDLTREQLDALVDEFVSAVGAGNHADAGWPTNAYSVSKVALNALTRIMARELPRLRLSSVGPGWVRTDMGGPSAPRSIEDGASGIVWAALREHGDSGGFFRDGKPIEW